MEKLHGSIHFAVNLVDTDCGPFYQAVMTFDHDVENQVLGPFARTEERAVKFALMMLTDKVKADWKKEEA